MTPRRSLPSTLALNAAIAVAPDYARGYEQRALALARQWRRAPDKMLRQRVIDDMNAAARRVGGDSSTFLPHGEVFDALGDTAAALEAFALWLQLEENVLATVARRNDVAKLETYADRVLADPRQTRLHADAHVLCALIHWTWDDVPAAAEAAEHALRRVPDHARALAIRGACLRRMGKPARGLSAGLEPALARFPDDLWALLRTAHAQEEAGHNACPTWQRLLHSADGPACPDWLRERARAASNLIAAPAHADAA